MLEVLRQQSPAAAGLRGGDDQGVPPGQRVACLQSSCPLEQGEIRGNRLPRGEVADQSEVHSHSESIRTVHSTSRLRISRLATS